MGQYYNIIIKERDAERVKAYDRHLDGQYTMAKLMEHSYYLNEMVNAVAEKLYHRPSQIAWVGDYADEDNLELWTYAWKRKRYCMLHKTEFTLNGRYIVNHTKKQIFDCWEYLIEAVKEQKNEWIIHPLPLLTAVGNGNGGGDYHGLNEESVGAWAWDELEIVDYERIPELKKQGYNPFSILFIEG